MAAVTLDEMLKETEIHPEKLSAPISDDHLCAIAIFLTSWRTVASYLGLSENDLDGVQQEGKDEQDKRLKALQIWKGKFGFKATYKKLVEGLLSLSMADVAEKICHLLKGMYMYFQLYIIQVTIFLHHKKCTLYTDIEHSICMRPLSSALSPAVCCWKGQCVLTQLLYLGYLCMLLFWF